MDSSTRGVWSLTEKDRGAELTHDQAAQIFKEVHAQFGGPKDVSKLEPEERTSVEDTPLGTRTPEEVDHRAALMGVMLALPASGFERLYQRLLRESGLESVTVTGKTGDGGIDGVGVLQVNPFVSFKVLFKCKRYIGSISPSQVRDFGGAMMGRTDKGLYVTTGSFTVDAIKEAIRDGVPPIECVDGAKLLDMFERLELGSKPKKAYDLDMTFLRSFKARSP